MLRRFFPILHVLGMIILVFGLSMLVPLLLSELTRDGAQRAYDLAALITAGVGPWLPFQMLAAGWFAYGAGCLPPMRGRAEVWLLAAYGAVGSLAYGLVMDLWFWPFGTEGASGITFVPGDPVGENLGRFLAFHVTTALGWDMVRAGTTVAITLILACATLAALVALVRTARNRGGR